MATTDTTQSQTRSTGDIARDYFGACAARDYERMKTFWHSDGVEDFIVIGPYHGPDAVTDVFRQIYAAVPDAELVTDQVIAEGDTAAVRWHMTGNFTGEQFMGVLATGRPIEIRGVDCIELEDGLIRLNTVYYDGLGFARDIGMLPPMDSPAERAMYAAFNALTRVKRALGRG